MRSALGVLASALAIAAAACQQAIPLPTYMGVPVCTHEVVSRFPHATDAFTQGLAYAGDRLIESTGIEGQSSLRDVELETGDVLRRVDLDDEYFAEGVAIVDDVIYQLTLTTEVGFVYDLPTFEEVGDFGYDGEGWGLAFDGNELVMSDGSARLSFRDAEAFGEVRDLAVTAGGEPVTRLNELEYIDGAIWANVWQTDKIAIVNPDYGSVTGWVDLAGLLPEEDRTETTSVLNGIAHDPTTGRTFVTGKFWPWLYEISVDCGTSA